MGARSDVEPALAVVQKWAKRNKKSRATLRGARRGEGSFDSRCWWGWTSSCASTLCTLAAQARSGFSQFVFACTSAWRSGWSGATALVLGWSRTLTAVQSRPILGDCTFCSSSCVPLVAFGGASELAAHCGLCVFFSGTSTSLEGVWWWWVL